MGTPPWPEDEPSSSTAGGLDSGLRTLDSRPDALRPGRGVEDSLLETAGPPPAVWAAIERELRSEGLIR